MEKLLEVEKFGRKVHVLADRGRIRGRKVQLMFGKGSWIGAGYIGGFTAFIAFNCVSPQNTGKRSMYVPRMVQVGVTRNGNKVPYTSN